MFADVSIFPPHRADTADLLAASGAMAASLDVLFTTAEIVIIAGDASPMIRLLRADQRVITLGDLQLAALLRREAADWGTWVPDDIASGRIEAELRAAAGLAIPGRAGS